MNRKKLERAGKLQFQKNYNHTKATTDNFYSIRESNAVES